MIAPDLSAISVDVLPASLHGPDIILEVLRLDKIHPFISGNKWFKLQNYLERFKKEKKKRLITFGGPWSNHIIATASIAGINKIPVTGLLRGERPAKLNPILKQATDLGMELIFLSREDYKQQKLPPFIDLNNDLVIPQGGYGQEGMKGAMRILDHCRKENYSHICCAVGTGTMMAGIVNAAWPGTSITGFSVMKNNQSLQAEMEELLLQPAVKYNIDHAFHFGGFGKHPPELLRFMNRLYLQTKIPTDIVYTAKLFYGVLERSQEGLFEKGSRVLIIHSGGLTGNQSLGNGKLIFPFL